MQHALKNDPAMRDLKHVQVDGPGLAYLFFHDRHRYRSLSKDEALDMRSHIADAFVEWIGRSTHFNVVPLMLEMQDDNVHGSHAREMQATGSTFQKNLFCLYKLKNLQVLDHHNSSVEYPRLPETQEGAAELEMPRLNAARPCRWQAKAKPTPGGGGGGGGGSPPSSPECPGRGRFRRLLYSQ